MANKRKWTKEKILEVMHEHLPKDKIITMDIITEYSKQGLIPNRTIIYYYFGNLKNACDQIGLKCNKSDKKHIFKKQSKLF